MRRPLKAARKLIVGLIGYPLLVLGAILVPLPGPGFLVMFIALALLATEYDWAGKYAETIKRKLKEIYEASKAKAEEIEKRGDKPKE
jgi:uncharacterized protein (TIGR02611 family)